MDDLQLIEVGSDNVVRFKMTSKLVTGFNKLVQIVVLTLLDVPGRNVLYPEDGGAIPSLIGQNIGITDTNELFSDITERVKRTQTQVIQNQIGLDDQSSEKLREIRIVELKRDDFQPDSVYVRLRIVNEAGRQVDVIV